MRNSNFKILSFPPLSVALLIEEEGVLTEDLIQLGGHFGNSVLFGPAWVFPWEKLEDLKSFLEADEIEYEITEICSKTF